MGILEIILIAISVSMDAFAVSICKGLASKNNLKKTAFVCGTWFGLFQMLMPLIGYFLALLFAKYIQSFDHWIAFTLLVLIGSNMVKESFSNETEELKNDLSFSKMLILAIATSIDALAVGITFALIKTNLYIALPTIGFFTFAFSFVGALIGSKIGEKKKKTATLAGGIILILLGIKILLEHLFF